MNTLQPKKMLKSILQILGLYEYLQRIKQLIVSDRYPFVKRFNANIENISVKFSTEDYYSNRWFFPRYAGGKIHEVQVTKLTIKSLKHANCFVDVGTNFGWYTCLASKHMPLGVVYGFEMDKLNYDLLRKNLEINNCTNVKAYNLAVSDSSGIIYYEKEDNSPSPSFRQLSKNETLSSKNITSMKSVTLDEFFDHEQHKPDVIKIDVEGAEINVLKGARQILGKYRPTLFVEVHPENLPIFESSVEDVLYLLNEYGYELFEIEDMRSQTTNRRLRKIIKTLKIEKNTMIYAVCVENIINIESFD